MLLAASGGGAASATCPRLAVVPLEANYPLPPLVAEEMLARSERRHVVLHQQLQRLLREIDHLGEDERLDLGRGDGVPGVGGRGVPLLGIGLEVVELLRVVDVADVMPVGFRRVSWG